MQQLWKYQFNSRSGDLESYFVSTEENLQEIIGTPIYFGEVLGKHSEVVLTFEQSDFVSVSTDPNFVQQFSAIIGSTGYNPFDYVEGE